MYNLYKFIDVWQSALVLGFVVLFARVRGLGRETAASRQVAPGRPTDRMLAVYVAAAAVAAVGLLMGLHHLVHHVVVVVRRHVVIHQQLLLLLHKEALIHGQRGLLIVGTVVGHRTRAVVQRGRPSSPSPIRTLVLRTAGRLRTSWALPCSTCGWIVVLGGTLAVCRTPRSITSNYSTTHFPRMTSTFGR